MLVYKIINKVNNKVYIGCTSCNIDKRFDEHWRHRFSSGCIKLARAFRKYGKENFMIELIEECETQEKMFEREIFWINKYNSMHSGIGYNMTTGGNKGAVKYGEDNWNYGKKKSHLLALNKNRIGTKLSEEHKAKVIKSLVGRKHSEETKQKMAAARKTKWQDGVYSKSHKLFGVKKKVAILCLNNYKVYDSYLDAQRRLPVDASNVGLVVRGGKTHTKGYVFQKLTEEHLIF